MGERENIFLSLVRELGIEVVCRKFDWLTNRITPSEESLWPIFIALGGDPEGMQGKHRRRLPPPDGYLPNYKCIIEFDELQHFTAFRARTFEHYPADARLGFDVDAYRSLCNQHATDALNKGAAGYRKPKPEFPFDGGRAAQRALFDACRDLLPVRHGLEPTVRISEFELPSLRRGRNAVKEEVRAALAVRL